VSTVPIIVPFGTFIARLTDINQPRNTTIIQGLVITATAIGVIKNQSPTGRLGAPVETPCNPALRSEYKERNWNVPEYDGDRYPRSLGD
jgi:hypothetical protein